MDFKQYAAPRSFEWSDTIPAGASRIIRTPLPAAASPVKLQQISVNFERVALPQPTVFELDATTGWAEFESAIARQEEGREGS